ncbi:MAG: glycosyltransferase [Candidatus Marinimicrobia bacterium]|nr:glycosyltransferase [Candidatus Neomarinimicrobiota bacterium]
MTIFIISVLGLATLSYGIFAFIISRGLILKQRVPTNSSKPDVAVIIAARNEEKNLPGLLSDLADQDYPGRLDIYIADDRSSDSTWSILDAFAKKHAQFHPLRIHERSERMTPKKNALTQCMKQTTAEFILSTDADCRLGPGWVSSAIASFDEEVGILVGYSQVETTNLFSKYQALDFIAVMVANAGMMLQGFVWSGSGQNLAYRRSAFTAIGGFNPVSHKISGDDVYLVQTIPRKTGLKAKFVTDKAHFVKTSAMNSIGEFINQRIRWSSNSKGLERSDPLFFGFLLSAFLTNILLLALFVSGVWAIGFWLLLGTKFLYEATVLVLGARKFGYWSLLKWYPLWFVIQPVYISYVGLMGLLGKFTWKP